MQDKGCVNLDGWIGLSQGSRAGVPADSALAPRK